MKGRRRNDEIGLREGIVRLAAILDQQSPFEHDVFGYREHALLEHGSYFVRKPVAELGATTGVGDEFNAKSNFGEGYRADMEKLERLGGDEGQDFAVRPGAA